MKNIKKSFKKNLHKILKLFLFLLSISLIVILFPHEGRFKYSFQEGKPWTHDDLIATFDFAIKKSKDDIEKEKEKLLADFKPFFRVDNKIYAKKRGDIEASLTDKWIHKYSETDVDTLIFQENLKFMLAVFDTLYSTGIIKFDEVLQDKSEDYTIVILNNNIAEEYELSDVYTIAEADLLIDELMSAVTSENIDQLLLLGVLKNSITQNVFYDRKFTENAKADKLSNVSEIRGLVQKGEIVISKGELINKDKFLILQSLKEEYEASLGGSSQFYTIIAGQTILVAISILILFLYLASFSKNVFLSNRKIIFLLLIIYIMVLATSMTIKYNERLLYLIPLCIVPILVRIFFDTRLALFIHIITITIIGFLVPNSFQFIFMQLIAGIVAIVSIVDVRKRAQLFITAFLVFITYSAIYTGLYLTQTGTLKDIEVVNFAWFAGSALLTLFSYPLIFIFEKIFGFVTDVTLMELSDTNSKLLRELNLKAPGTFQHVLQVANIAEAVVYEIGGNPLLVRTGALYHDIGKMDMPSYFIENLRSSTSPHDELSYLESAQIIMSHVDKGVEIAKKHKIPEKIVDFIRTHHGTTSTMYFYQKYKNENPDIEVDKGLFTYNGPIPYSKETAVLMMTDSVEAASRSLDNPDEKSINDLVENIINAQMKQNQFVNADITFKDITSIKRICKKMLQNIYHVRIAYPEEKK